ncbi:MAG: hypothetical protein KDJ90_14720 [Nitratireductor sp.]|nr:hypothetical protein [Nitratireductor sp.]
MDHAAILLMMTEVAEEYDEAFNDWYDNEHIPELLALPGLVSAERYRIVGEGIRYLALYRLADTSVPESEAYVTWRDNSESTKLWTSRFIHRERHLYALMKASS